MEILFTDLDGTLLDHHSYAWDAARPAIEQLRRRGIPWIFVSSKTRTEIEYWRHTMGNPHSFIVENGGAAYIPCQNGYDVFEWGTRYWALVADLVGASQESQCRVRGFHQMDVRAVAELCNLPLEQAALARQREYDEPFLVLDEERAEALVQAIERRGRNCTRGGRFWHILGANDKAVAVRALMARFGATHSIGLGDGLNDAPFLNAVDTAVIIGSPQSAQLKALVPHGTVTEQSGPVGWNQAVLAWLDQV